MVDSWFVRLNASEPFSPEQLEWLDGYEIERYLLIKDETKAKRFAAAHIALRQILGNYLNVRPFDIEFYSNQYGKPFINGGPAFSLSRSSDGILIAISARGTIGADLERIKTVDFQSILCDICSDSELKRFSQYSYNQIDWLRFWVRKEAAVKAIGTGLQSLSDVAIPFYSKKSDYFRVTLRQNGNLKFWYLYDLDIPYGFMGSIVTNQARIVKPIKIVDIFS
ncbi:Phosphopantetheinyl transferase (Sfp) (PDB:1QR0) [Commensalibacter communis]|uniref:Phosphopantetheinyl transferase (Sfp) n=1 Tax=Commensalibacter communis TaxID=2972786 RepID=A0A9W4XIP0_9PROT|nr:4'-phosphopantetheinyl transferase superfamily protein [Commensalibacter communis]CAI3955697.1 Phosphopantetheinyl transferase (Sfp) (PDB:1QR0) [Commensalibacter communis]CAI3957868.1 Phosphopantetheinyl transferase (Sfp) (PDB:1QR0) [Commensalibacter communis]CAI3957986.1 Phosphopantetheinyl transferase (Sfp) (PDB:1QR0) [Commensalibacter communis]CAI3959203.1 Phosphopantetheinyl transferase (Sfp) (PDB:1QR0) [Commensalibacter communis]